VFDHTDGILLVHKSLQHLQKLFHIGKVEACCGLIDDIDGFPGLPAGKFQSQLDPLGLASLKGQGRLPQLDISQPLGLQGMTFSEDRRNG